jgi:hypothetical protein
VPAEHELRTAAPSHATGAVEFVVLAELAPDETFRLRPDGDVSLLATSLGRLGQLAPVELRPWPGAGSDGPRWQVVSGFRRLAATRLLARDRVLARLHRELSDEDAWGLTLGEALLREPLSRDELEALRERLRATGAAPWAVELVDEARVRAPVGAELREQFFEWLSGGALISTAPAEPSQSRDSAPGQDELGQGVPAAEGADAVEVTPEDLTADLVSRLAGLNQDLAIALEAWKDLPLEGRRQLLEQARWLAQAVPYMESEE